MTYSPRSVSRATASTWASGIRTDRACTRWAWSATAPCTTPRRRPATVTVCAKECCEDSAGSCTGSGAPIGTATGPEPKPGSVLQSNARLLSSGRAPVPRV
jgi:hypothetical protein